MSDLDALKVPFRPFNGRTADTRYVAFVDILGFGRKIQENFDDVLKVYEQVLEASQIINVLGLPGVSLRIYSDAFLITSESLSTLVRVVKALHLVTLAHDCLVRGGIGFGKHIDVSHGDNFYVISQALVHAVEVEKSIKRPCVALHESVDVPHEWWRSNDNTFGRGVLFFDGVRLVNPFSVFWGRSAASRVSRLSEQYPEHQDKYRWFLALYNAVVSGELLAPQ